MKKTQISLDRLDIINLDLLSEEILKEAESITASYLSLKKKIGIFKTKCHIVDKYDGEDITEETKNQLDNLSIIEKIQFSKLFLSPILVKEMTGICNIEDVEELNNLVDWLKEMSLSTL